MEVSDEFRWEWVSIPHIYGTPFYVYAYAFGQLLVFALYQQYQARRRSFQAALRARFSPTGGSQAPDSVLATPGSTCARPPSGRAVTT